MGIIATLEADLHAIWATLEAEGHHAADEVRAVIDRLKAGAPALAADAETDLAQVVRDAATEGVGPAARQAVADAEHLAGEAVADVGAAVKGAGGAPDAGPVA